MVAAARGIDRRRVPRDKLFPLDLNRAYKKLDTIKPHVAAWWKSGDNSMQILRGGDAVYEHALFEPRRSA